MRPCSFACENTTPIRGIESRGEDVVTLDAHKHPLLESRRTTLVSIPSRATSQVQGSYRTTMNGPCLSAKSSKRNVRGDVGPAAWCTYMACSYKASTFALRSRGIHCRIHALQRQGKLSHPYSRHIRLRGGPATRSTAISPSPSPKGRFRAMSDCLGILHIKRSSIAITSSIERRSNASPVLRLPPSQWLDP